MACRVLVGKHGYALHRTSIIKDTTSRQFLEVSKVAQTTNSQPERNQLMVGNALRDLPLEFDKVSSNLCRNCNAGDDGECIMNERNESYSEAANKPYDLTESHASGSTSISKSNICEETNTDCNSENIPMEREEKGDLQVTDVLNEAVSIGEDAETLNKTHGDNVTANLMPKLMMLLDKLEIMVTKHDENKGTIKALTIEQEDLTMKRTSVASERRQSEVKLEEAQKDLKETMRQLDVRAKILSAENKVITKDVKKKTKKIKKKKNGQNQDSLLWLIDRALFGGRIFFVTRELPRDVITVKRLNEVIHSQHEEIEQLTREIELRKKGNGSAINVSIHGNIYASVDKAVSVDVYVKENPGSGSTPIDNVDNNRILIIDSAEDFQSDSSTVGLSSNCLCSENENESVDSPDVTGNEVTDENASEDGHYHEATEETDTESVVKEADVRPNDFTYEVKVDVHSNRKDYKKLLHAHELRDSIALKNEPSFEFDTEEFYTQSCSDTKSNSSCEDKLYHWDEVDSKTSYEDVNDIKSSDEKLHMYFVIDKENLNAKRVGYNEYQKILERSVSMKGITNIHRAGYNTVRVDN